MNIIKSNLEFKSNYTLRNLNILDEIILHHSGCSIASDKDIHKWHLEKGYAGAGYNFLVRKSGLIFSLRPIEWVGAHCYNHNTNTIGICFEGNFETEIMEEKQINAGIELILYLKKKYNINKISKHKDYNNTECPGKNFPFNELINSKTVEIVDNYVDNSNDKEKLIKELQNEFNKQFGSNLIIDGIFGEKSKQASKNVSFGAKGNITRIIQALLILKGYDVGTIDGIFGSMTKSAVKQFQVDNNLFDDGIVGKETFYKLCN